MNKAWKIAMMIVLGIAAFLLFIFGFQYLWNWLMPEIFGWKAINYWQAMGLFVLSKILFKGFTWNSSHKARWGTHWKAKWNNMSPEERELFKQKMREKCGWVSKSESNAPNN